MATDRTNAERQRRYIARLKEARVNTEQAAQSTSTPDQFGPYQVLRLNKKPQTTADGKKVVVLSVRISADLKRRMDEVATVGPYHITLTSLAERGIELAIKELETLRKGLADD